MGLLDQLLYSPAATPGFDQFPVPPVEVDAGDQWEVAARRLRRGVKHEPRLTETGPVPFLGQMPGMLNGSVAGGMPQFQSSDAAPVNNDLPPSTNDPASSEPVVFSDGVPVPRPRPITPNTPASVPGQPTDMSSANIDQSGGAPLSISPPASAAPAPAPQGPGFLGGLGGALGGLLKPENAPLLLALGSGLSGAPSFGTGMRRASAAAAPAAMLMQKEMKSQQSQKATFDALVARGVPRGEAIAAVLNPDLMKAVASKYFETKPLTHYMNEDMFGNKTPGSFDPNTGVHYGPDGKAKGAATTDASATNGMPANVDHTLVGDDYLKQFPAEIQSAVRNYVRGDSMPTGNPRKGFTQAVKMIAQKYGEDTGVPVSDQKYVERRQYRNQLASGNSGVGAQRNALRQGLEHLESVTDSAGKLGNVDLGVTWLTTPVNTMRGWSTGQQAKVNEMKNKVQQLSGEIGKFFSGSQGGGVHERDETRKRFDAVSSPQELAAAIESSLDLLEGGLHAREQQRDEILGPNSGVEILSGKDRERVTRIRELAAKLKGGGKAPAAPPAGKTGTGVQWSIVQ